VLGVSSVHEKYLTFMIFLNQKTGGWLIHFEYHLFLPNWIKTSLNNARCFWGTNFTTLILQSNKYPPIMRRKHHVLTGLPNMDRTFPNEGVAPLWADPPPDWSGGDMVPPPLYVKICLGSPVLVTHFLLGIWCLFS